MVSVVVAPGPVFFLFFRRDFAELAASIPVSFVGPLAVENHFVIVPYVIVGVVGVVYAIVVMTTRASRACCSQRRSKKKRKEGVKAGTHAFLRKFSCGGDAGRC